jgi:predicted dehydrogenase
MQTMINAAIVGLGRWGQGLVDSVKDSRTIRFTAGVTRTVAKAEEFCRERGIGLTADYDAMLADPSVDAVVLATPHTQHFDQIVAAAKAGKHVFCEKPFTLTRKSAQQAVDAVARVDKVVGVGHNRRFMANMIEARRMIEAGELGTLLHVETNFSANLAPMARGAWRDSREESPAGGMTSLGIHAVDALINLCGPMTVVDARSKRRASGSFDFDDTTCALLDFENGMTGYLGTMAAGGRLWFVRVFGEKGWVELRGTEQLVICDETGEQTVRETPSGNSLGAELEAFGIAAEGGKPFPITPDEIVHGVAVLEAVITSAESGKRVKVG